MDAAKGIGCLCILSASIMTGYYLTNSLKRRWHFFREIYEILAFLEQETVLRHAVLHEALYDAAKNCRTEVRGILLYTAEAVRLRRMGNFAQIWEEAVRRLPDDMLMEEERLVLFEVSDALCCTDIITQKLLLQKYKDRFLSLCKKEEAAYQEKGRLYSALSAAGGVFLVILLL